MIKYKFKYGDHSTVPLITSTGWSSIDSALKYRNTLINEGWGYFTEIESYEYSEKENKNNVLIKILFEEFSSNGGHFSSPDSDFWFAQSFGEFGESTQEIFKRLLNLKS